MVFYYEHLKKYLKSCCDHPKYSNCDLIEKGKKLHDAITLVADKSLIPVIYCKVLNTLGFFHCNRHYYNIIDDPRVNPKHLNLDILLDYSINDLVTKHDHFILDCYLSNTDYGYERTRAIGSYFMYLNQHKEFALLSIFEKYRKSFLLEKGSYDELKTLTEKKSFGVNWGLPIVKYRYNSIIAKILTRIDMESDYYDSSIVDSIIHNDEYARSLGSMRVITITNTEKVKAIKSTLSKRLKAKIKKGITTHYVCSQCGNNECEKIEFQGRSLDEATTIIISCNDCSYRWQV